MSKNFHEKPFDEGTLLKLSLFEKYAQAWLPVFVSKDNSTWPAKINIVDFFAGKGTDLLGKPGSPLILREVVRAQHSSKWRPGSRVNIYLSDADSSKTAHLEALLQKNPLNIPSVNIDVAHADFKTRFQELKPILADRQSANLIIIDQFGVKQVPKNVFDEIIRLDSTDTLIFVSSNTFRRFGHLPEVQRITLPGYNRPTDYYKAHLAVADAFRQAVPPDVEYHIGSFSIKKGSNIYGILFGTKHPLGIDKFLQVAWNMDPVVGTANFDIEREGIALNQDFLFEGMEVPNKVQHFHEKLEDYIAKGQCVNERDIITLCHKHGVCRKHSTIVLEKMKKDGRIKCDFKVPDINKFREPRSLVLV